MDTILENDVYLDVLDPGISSLATLSCSSAIQWSIRPDSFSCWILVLNLHKTGHIVLGWRPPSILLCCVGRVFRQSIGNSKGEKTIIHYCHVWYSVFVGELWPEQGKYPDTWDLSGNLIMYWRKFVASHITVLLSLAFLMASSMS